jgi:hypothetical protein
MFRRFVSGSAVAATVIALVALVIMVAPALAVRRLYPIPIMWLAFAPLVWGLWAMVAPSAWVPQRLPIWGAILGLIAGLLGAFVLNLPSRVLGETVPVTLRGVGVGVIVVAYYFLWMLVRIAYRSLGSATSRA